MNGGASFWRQTRALTWPFWATNIMEMVERLAYYGVRVVIPIYIAQADEPAGLHFTQGDKGFIFMWWALVQSALPVFTGGFADRYGYKRQIVIAVAFKALGYVIMATQREFWPFFAGCMILAAGTAIFKPPIQGTFVRTLDEKSSGAGWGYFYMVVNIGGFLGPPLAHFLYGWSWPMVFYGCAVLVCLNLLMLLTYREVCSGDAGTSSAWDVLKLTATNILNARLVAFILIMSAFWAGAMQLFDMLPNFIVDWVDSSALAARLPGFMLAQGGAAPRVAQEWIINLNPLLIILFVAPLSWLVNRWMSRLNSMVAGIVLSGIGMLVAGAGMPVLFCLAGIALFSLGEMLSSPKMNEYLGVIAPPDRKALYMGYANIPLAIGWAYGSFLGGKVYEASGEKAGLALRYLSEALQASPLPPRSAAFARLVELTGLTPDGATLLLWQTYSPGRVWYPFVIASLIAAAALVAFNLWLKRKGSEDYG
ncbi:MAG: MFS transporter [Spirochaetes bacterium]|nr:MFS transporter [Spirochaetota bacterium]